MKKTIIIVFIHILLFTEGYAYTADFVVDFKELKRLNATPANLNKITNGGQWSKVKKSGSGICINSEGSLTFKSDGKGSSSGATLTFNTALPLNETKISFDIAYEKWNAELSGLTVSGLDNDSKKVFEIYFSCGFQKPNGQLYHPLRGGLNYLSKSNKMVTDKNCVLTKDFGKEGGIYSMTLNPSGYKYSVDYHSKSLNSVTSAKLIPYHNSVNELRSIIFSIVEETGKTGISFKSIKVSHTSNRPHVEIDSQVTDNTVNWSAKDEKSIKMYQIIDSRSDEVLEVFLPGSGAYTTTVPPNTVVKIKVIHSNGDTYIKIPKK